MEKQRPRSCGISLAEQKKKKVGPRGNPEAVCVCLVGWVVVVVVWGGARGAGGVWVEIHAWRVYKGTKGAAAKTGRHWPALLGPMPGARHVGHASLAGSKGKGPWSSERHLPRGVETGTARTTVCRGGRAASGAGQLALLAPATGTCCACQDCRDRNGHENQRSSLCQPGG